MTMHRSLAVILGFIFLIVGVLGFFSAFSPGGKLLNIFAVNLEHNVVHLASGILAVLSGLTSRFAARAFFVIFGLVYAVVAVMGFMMGEGMLFNMIAINTADNYLHAVIAAFCLIIGFVK